MDDYTWERTKLIRMCNSVGTNEIHAFTNLIGLENYHYSKHYAHIEGVDVPLLLEAQAAHNSRQAKIVGDFYREEHQEQTADTYYKKALSKGIEEASEGNNEAMFRLSEQYAFGEGTEQSHEKSYFWCLKSAYEGNPDAVNMMQNFWQDGGAVPVSKEMAQAWKRVNEPIKPAPHIAELYEAAAEAELAAEGLQMNRTKELERAIHVRSKEAISREKPLSGLKRLISNLLDKIVTIYMFGSALMFLISYFFGYHETGFLNLINKAFYYLLGIPGKLFLVLITDMKFSEITLQIFCENYEWGRFSIAELLVSALAFVLSAAVFCVWYYILHLIYYLLAGEVLTPEIHPGIAIEVRPADKAKQKHYEDKMRFYQNQLNSTKQKITHDIKKYRLTEFDDYISICALCDIVTMMQVSLPEAARLYKEWEAYVAVPSMEIFYGNNDGEEAFSLWMIDKKSDPHSSRMMELYFWLRRSGFIYKKTPLEDFGLKSKLSVLSRNYRKGTNYEKIGKELESLTQNNSISLTEQAYAHWYLSRLYNQEFIPYEGTDYRGIKTKESKETARKHMYLANKKRCPLADVDTALWQKDIYTLKAVAKKYKNQENVYGMLCAVIKHREAIAKCYGDPLNLSKWDEFKTGNPWPAYQKALEEYNKPHEGTDFDKYGAKTAYLNESIWMRDVMAILNPYYKSGLRRADELYESLKDSVELAEFALEGYKEHRIPAAQQAHVPSIITDDMGRDWYLDGAVLGGARYRLAEGNYRNPDFDLGDSLGTTVEISDGEIQKGSANSIGRSFHW